MFQTVGHEALSVLSEATGGLPLFRGDLGGDGATPSKDTGPDYDPEVDPGDEVEALYRLINTARESVPFDAVCSGAILSDYQRVRVENV